MKKIFVLPLALCCSVAFSQIKLPASSSLQMLSQNFGLGKLEIAYSRPNLNGRKAFEENSSLAPIGKVWRTGANAVTTLQTDNMITIGGQPLEAGSYAIFTIPGIKEWTIIINKDSKNWGTEYAPQDDLFQIKVPVVQTTTNVETFTIQFTDVEKESCKLQLSWGTTVVALPIATDIKDKIRVSVEKALREPNIPATVYQSAANFYYELDKNLSKALENAAKATEANPKAFYLFLLKAKIEKDLGDKDKARADAQKCIDLATEQKIDDYVRAGKEFIKQL